MNTNLQLADLVSSIKPVIIGAPPACNSKFTKAKRLFYDGSHDYKGPDRLPNLAKTRIKKRKQVGGGKGAKGMSGNKDEVLSLSPSPTPVSPHTTLPAGAKRSAESTFQERDEVLSLSPSPTPIILRTATVHTDAKRSAESTFQEREEVLSLSPSPTPTTIRATKSHTGAKRSTETLRAAPKAGHGHRRPEIVLPTKPCRRTPAVITLRDTSESEEGPGDSAALFVSDDKEDPSTRKRKRKGQQSSRATKRVALSPDGDTIHRTAPGVVKAQAQAKPVMKKARVRFPSPLDSQSFGEELEGHSTEGHRSTATLAPKGLHFKRKWSSVCNTFLIS